MITHLLSTPVNLTGIHNSARKISSFFKRMNQYNLETVDFHKHLCAVVGGVWRLVSSQQIRNQSSSSQLVPILQTKLTTWWRVDVFMLQRIFHYGCLKDVWTFCSYLKKDCTAGTDSYLMDAYLHPQRYSRVEWRGRVMEIKIPSFWWDKRNRK